ncbi:hypothetical protein H4R20_000564 [Coemansia guatemalensis]|uniref:Nucleoporin Nup54 alpha-helical domain-containing protein n=1 Tax=Coemansia guatemalensis TaxID=2761395 RepID=A0A9W8HYM5_9FUNG|nr:hypothetical protein H4R20_000564 [Coemansia guatemalensis]
MSTFGKSFSFSTGAAAAGNGQGTPAGSLFGASAQPPASSGGSLFGGSLEKRQRAGSTVEAPAALQSTTGSGFGQTSTAASGGSLFSGTQTTNPGAGGLQSGGPSFGAASSNASGFTGGGIFGGTSVSQQPQSSSIFGTASTGAAPNTLFGNQQQQQQPQPQPQQSAQPPVQQSLSDVEELGRQLMLIKECWDPASPSYQFRHYFYNVADPEQVHLYQCPPGQDPVLWQQALSDNPDPSTLVPVLASGFEDLRKRVDSQSLQMQSYQERTSEVSAKLCDILQKHHSDTTVRLAECRRRQADLSQRLLEFMKLLQLLRLRGQLLHPEEELFRVRVEHLEKEVSRSGSLKQRLAELQDHIYRLQANARRRRELLGLSGTGHPGDGYEVADESQLESVMKVLGDKQRGLARMTQVVSQDAESIECIERAVEDRHTEVLKQREAQERVQVARSLVHPW